MRNTYLLAALGAILGGGMPLNAQKNGTLPRRQCKQPPKPEWLQKQLKVKAAEKRARKATRHRVEGVK